MTPSLPFNFCAYTVISRIRRSLGLGQSFVGWKLLVKVWYMKMKTFLSGDAQFAAGGAGRNSNENRMKEGTRKGFDV